MATIAESKISAADAKALAQEAYVFGLPLVYVATHVSVNSHVTKPEGLLAPINQIAHYREFPDANFKAVVGINVDTLYTNVEFDLTEEPLVLSIPEMGDRFWLMQIIDAWNEVPGAPGSRTDGGKGGNFVIAGPNFSGSVPDGLTLYRVATNVGAIGGRTYVAGKDDLETVHRIQDQYRVTPLSKWGSDYKPPAEVPLKPGVDSKTPVPKQVSAMSAETYFSRLCDLLVNNPPHAADAPVMARMARLGIAPGAKFAMDAFDADVRKAIEEGVAAGRKEILDAWPKAGEMVNGWRLARDLGRYGTKYAYRAAWTYFGIGGNLVEDAFYPLTSLDKDGNKLTGANKYVLRFSKGQSPPVDAFWSLTMYDVESYLVPNPIDRYALGDRSNMKLDSDGSLPIYIQHESPGPDRQANWLPAPEGEMLLAMRLYRPKKEVADGKWNPPAVEKTG